MSTTEPCDFIHLTIVCRHYGPSSVEIGQKGNLTQPEWLRYQRAFDQRTCCEVEQAEVPMTAVSVGWMPVENAEQLIQLARMSAPADGLLNLDALEEFVKFYRSITTPQQLATSTPDLVLPSVLAERLLGCIGCTMSFELESPNATTERTTRHDISETH